MKPFSARVKSRLQVLCLSLLELAQRELSGRLTHRKNYGSVIFMHEEDLKVVAPCACFVRHRVQFDFHAETLHFDGTEHADEIRVLSLFFGDTLIFADNVGIPLPALSKMLKLDGHVCSAGLDISMNLSVQQAGRFVAYFVGKKPIRGGW